MKLSWFSTTAKKTKKTNKKKKQNVKVDTHK